MCSNINTDDKWWTTGDGLTMPKNAALFVYTFSAIYD